MKPVEVSGAVGEIRTPMSRGPQLLELVRIPVPPRPQIRVPTVGLEPHQSGAGLLAKRAGVLGANWYRRRDSNPHWTGSKPAASADWATSACVRVVPCVFPASSRGLRATFGPMCALLSGAPCNGGQKRRRPLPVRPGRGLREKLCRQSLAGRPPRPPVNREAQQRDDAGDPPVRHDLILSTSHCCQGPRPAGRRRTRRRSSVSQEADWRASRRSACRSRRSSASRGPRPKASRPS